MALTYSAATQMGAVAPDFNLPGVDGKNYTLKSFEECKALLVIFICNHCPYVIAIQDRLLRLAEEYMPKGLGIVAINSNDTVKYPDDSFEKMKLRASEKRYPFPYLFDESQSVAKAYDAACTPDPYLYQKVGDQFVLRYHGRIDDHWKDESQVKSRDLSNAVNAVLTGGKVAMDQLPSMGCNIKWK